MHNDTSYFEDQSRKGFQSAMVLHRKAMCFDWKSFDEWIWQKQVTEVFDTAHSQLAAQGHVQEVPL